jgi:hypothetical protein
MATNNCGSATYNHHNHKQNLCHSPWQEAAIFISIINDFHLEPITVIFVLSFLRIWKQINCQVSDPVLDHYVTFSTDVMEVILNECSPYGLTGGSGGIEAMRY